MQIRAPHILKIFIGIPVVYYANLEFAEMIDVNPKLTIFALLIVVILFMIKEYKNNSKANSLGHKT